jgi:hypothetical protein
MSENEVSLRVDGRLLHPVRMGDRRWLYDVEELRAVIERSKGTAGQRPFVTGETTAETFELFETGKTLAQVVIATKQTAETVMYLRSEYDRMVGSMVLPASTVSQLQRALGPHIRPQNLGQMVEAHLARMFEEGREDATSFGVVRDAKTGEMKPILGTQRRNTGVPPSTQPWMARTQDSPAASGIQAQGEPSGDPPPPSSPAEPDGHRETGTVTDVAQDRGDKSSCR